jgi:hypothetical protein
MLASLPSTPTFAATTHESTRVQKCPSLGCSRRTRGSCAARPNADHERTRKREIRRRKKQKETYLAHGVDVDVVLGVLGVGDEGLDQELPQNTVDCLDPLLLACSRLDPLAGLSPGLVQGQETALASPLDQLIWLRNELGARSQQPRVCGLGLVEHALDVGIGCEVQRRELGRRVVCRGGRQRSGLDDGGAGEVVVEDGLAVGLEDRFGRHCAGVSNVRSDCSSVSRQLVSWETGQGSGRDGGQ